MKDWVAKDECKYFEAKEDFMPKIIKFKTENDRVVEFLEELIKEVKTHNIDNVLVACKDIKGEAIFTGYCNLSMGEKQELLGHIQIDIVKDMINQNYVTP